MPIPSRTQPAARAAALLVWLSCASAAAQTPQGLPKVEDIAIPPAPEGGEVLPLTLDEALRLGAMFNTGLRTDELVPLQAAADVRAARGVFEPELYTAAEVARSKDPTRNIFQPALSREVYSAEVGVRQLLPTGGLFDLTYAPAKIRQTSSIAGFPERQFTSSLSATYTQPLLKGAWSDYTLRDVQLSEVTRAAAELRYYRLVQDTLIAIVRAYWDLVFARENYRVAHRALDLAGLQLARTNQRIEVGELAPLDRVADEAEVARRREELVIAEFEIRRREDSLRRLVFDDRDGELWRRQLEPVTPIGEVVPPPDFDWRELARAARRARFDLRALRAEVGAAEIRYRAASNEVLPRLDLVGSYTTDSVRDQFSDAWSDSTDFQFPDWSIRLELSIPVGNSTARALRDRAELEVERTLRALYAAEMDIEFEVRDAVRQLRTLAETVLRGHESVRLAETNLQREAARLEAGESTTLEVQLRNQELQEARSRLLRNELDFRIAEANLHYVKGDLGHPEPAPEGSEPPGR